MEITGLNILIQWTQSYFGWMTRIFIYNIIKSKDDLKDQEKIFC